MADYDIAIAGGGPAGAAAAIILAKAGRRVMLTNAPAKSDFRIGESLPPNARSLLDELDALPGLVSTNHRSSPGTIAYWGTDAAHFTHAISKLHGRGWILDRRHFDAMLREVARASGAELHDSASLRLVEPGNGNTAHRVQIRDGDGQCRDATASWVVDASGRAAALSRRFGARRIACQPLLAFYQKFRGGSDVNACIMVEAAEDCWWYSALLPDCSRLVACFGAPAPTQRRLLQTTDGLWQAMAKTPRLHALCIDHKWRPSGHPGAAIASGGVLDRTAGERWLAVGDAALTFDPLSSKGISNALYTGISGARCILAAQAGNSRASATYSAHLHGIYATYREELVAMYAAEKRWPHSAFWRSRSALPASRRDQLTSTHSTSARPDHQIIH